MFPQEFAKFVLEACLAVVRILVLDIPFHLIEVGGADAE
jgi:hypothetical protein